MMFLTESECAEKFSQCGFRFEPSHGVVRPKDRSIGVRIRYDEKVNLFDLSRRLVGWMERAEWLLLLITEDGVWPSWENLHLYQRLRESYGGSGPLATARGHYFSRNEIDDAITFLHLATTFGWGGYLIGGNSAGHVIFSHDEWMAFETSETFNQLKAKADGIAIPVEMYSL